MKTVLAKDIMRKQFVSVTEELGVIVALRELLKHKQSHAPVLDSAGKVVGMFSEGDCIRGTLMGSYFEGRGNLVAEQMTSEVNGVSPDTELVTIADAFLKHNRHVLPVIEADKVVGLVSRTEILACLLQEIDHK